MIRSTTATAASRCCTAPLPALFFYYLLLACIPPGISSLAIHHSPEAKVPPGATFELPSISHLAAVSDNDNDRSPINGSRGEVVGATGRIGSFLLRSGCGTLAATPRGVCPGSLSGPGKPIFVAVHAAAVPDVVQSTLPSRRPDLVFVTNGLPSRILAGSLDGGHESEDDSDGLLQSITLSVPHFGVLSVGGDVVTASSSPPTIVHGKHSSSLAALLQPQGIVVGQVSSRSNLEAAAVKKLLWSSIMWILCHEGLEEKGDADGTGNASNGSKPITVAEVHEKKEWKLRALVEELLPAANIVLGQGNDLGTVDEMLAYFRSYSLSMPNAIPSKDLALNELPERNGLFINPDADEQSMHKALLERVAGPDACAVAMCRDDPSSKQNDRECRKAIMHSACPSMGFIARISMDRSSRTTAPKVKDAVVVGGGFIGSSVALALSRRGIRVVVLDRRDINISGDIGEATTASWAWLNANDKAPWSYFSLNQLGMKVWRHDKVLKTLPVWCGGLVRRTKKPRQERTGVEDDPAKGGGYVCIGPLTRNEVLVLDPVAEFLGELPKCGEEISFYADEGHVDPIKATRTIREEASRLGAKFVGNTNVEKTLVDCDDVVCGVITDDGTKFEADVVVVAAGVGSKELSGIDVMRQPGMIALTKPASAKSSAGREGVDLTGDTPRRILVDTINESHILQRREGELAIGGGYLQVGGVASMSQLGGLTDRKKKEDDKNAAAKEMIRSASQVSPSAIESVEFSHAESADRPMPRDGLPAVGFLRPGLFCVVSHSGITLGPLLGELAAIELQLCDQAAASELLEDYRPTRFDNYASP
mmetsp:Transcript_22195/g.63677  ORF Transcript_22195/g.63677 Transcript_22195/m.63677 type:complete len:821 (-) Transcript_22195:141-2603(-)